jgi:predicted ATPase
MISLIEALNFRCLHYIRQSLGPFHILVGPNASGKTTFLDVVAFLGQLVSDGIDTAITERTEDVQDLVWGRAGDRFELAIEAVIPEKLRAKLRKSSFDTIRYEVAIGIDKNSHEGLILAEKALLKTSELFKNKKKKSRVSSEKVRSLFPMEVEPPDTILTGRTPGAHTVVNKIQGGDDHFYSEVYREPGKGWMPVFKFGHKKLSLTNLPGDESQYPVATWLKDLLSEGVQQFILNSMAMRKASQKGKIKKFMTDGSNLPWVIHRLKETDLHRFNSWIAHLKTALPDIENIKTIERPHDRYRYLVICYRGNLDVPSWLASDGTLRLLALTLPAYLPDFKGIYLVEEPENGIHPTAVETMFQSLSSIYDAQILLATHSPIILGIAKPEEVLCFAKNKDGATDIVLGSEHPSLREWKRETNLGTLFAAGVLG